MINSFLEQLNQNQKEAVCYNEGPSLVIAGAGSGKTRVLTYKIAYLLSQGYQPYHILALTFTNKAAKEMKERIGNIVGAEQSSQLWMGTFHSIFSKILRYEAQAIGFTSNFTIYDQSDSRSLLKSIIKEMALDDKVYKPNVVGSHISNAKNHLLFPSAYQQNAEVARADDAAKIPATGEIYRRYFARCAQADVMDFDDLLLYTYRLFNEHPDILAKYEERFKFVLVDEYQDTNYAQYQIVWLLTKAYQKLCVVGDDAQSIYSFRGANIGNILNFTNTYKGAKLFKLEQNYRSTQNIVSLANSLISHNKAQIKKNTFSANSVGDKIKLIDAYTDLEEAVMVVKEIVSLKRNYNNSNSDFAVLYRTNAQSRKFEEVFLKNNLPYRVYGGLSFYQRKEIKDVLAYLRLIMNPLDEEAFKRIINYPVRGIGNTTINKIMLCANEQQMSPWQVISTSIDLLSVNKGTKSKLQAFCNLIQSFSDAVNQINVYELGMKVIKETGISSELYVNNDPETLAKRDNIEELLNAMHDFVDSNMENGDTESIYLSDYLQNVALLTDQDESNVDDNNKITLMTVHSAKGLEFKNVFVVGLEEDLFPSSMAGDSIKLIEEERRLLYVAITRAEERCFLSYAHSRIKYGKVELCSPSRFISDLDSNLLLGKTQMYAPKKTSFQAPRPTFSTRPASTPPAGFKRMPTSSSVADTSSVLPANGASLQAGMKIRHERFGIGDVLAIDGAGENRKATVKFENLGTKQLLLRFARFDIL